MLSSDLQHSCPACLSCVSGAAAVSSAAVCSTGFRESMCTAKESSVGRGALQSVYLAPFAPQQCFSFEEDDLNLTSLDAETILEAEEILGTMQNYLDSSVISIIEDLSLSEVGAHTHGRGKRWLGWLWLWHGWGWRLGPVAMPHCPLRLPLPLQQGKACLDAQNELSLLTAITEILDSTDDETLSPFDTIMDAELLTSPRERENPSVSCGAEPV